MISEPSRNESEEILDQLHGTEPEPDLTELMISKDGTCPVCGELIKPTGEQGAARFADPREAMDQSWGVAWGKCCCEGRKWFRRGDGDWRHQPAS